MDVRCQGTLCTVFAMICHCNPTMKILKCRDIFMLSKILHVNVSNKNPAEEWWESESEVQLQLCIVFLYMPMLKKKKDIFRCQKQEGKESIKNLGGNWPHRSPRAWLRAHRGGRVALSVQHVARRENLAEIPEAGRTDPSVQNADPISKAAAPSTLLP